MLEPEVGDKCLVNIHFGGSTQEDPPDLSPPCMGVVVYINRINRLCTEYTIKLLEDAKGCEGWHTGDSYRTGCRFLHPLPPETPTHV